MFIGVLIIASPLLVSILMSLSAWAWLGYGMVGGFFGGTALIAGAALVECGG